MRDVYADRYFITITCRVRGWLGIERSYMDGADVTGEDIVRNESPKARLELVKAKLEIMYTAFYNRIMEDRSHPKYRYMAAEADFIRWSDARWSLIDKYAAAL